MSQSEAVKSRRSPPAREARVIPIANDRKLGGRRRRFRSKTSFAAAVGKPAWRAVFSYASVALKSLQHFLLNLLMLAGVAPQHMLQKKEILLMNFLFAFEIGVGLEQRDRLPVAPIGCLDAFLVELAPNIRNAPVNVRRHRDVANLLLHLC